jgi:hypothetical protein
MSVRAYDRQLLLLGAKRNAELDLLEVQRYGTDSYGDPDYVSIYGLRPADWYAKGVRVLGRTAVECTRDVLANAIGKDIAGVAAAAPAVNNALMIDPFAGSGNTLYWMLRHLPGARGVGFELDPVVARLTLRNFATLKLPVRFVQTDYQDGLANLIVPKEQLLVFFIAPPWGDALSDTTGLDLRRTAPPVTEVVDFAAQRFAENPLLFAIQVYEVVDASSVTELKTRFHGSALRVYSFNAPGQNHGVLLGTRGFTSARFSDR